MADAPNFDFPPGLEIVLLKARNEILRNEDQPETVRKEEKTPG